MADKSGAMAGVLEVLAKRSAPPGKLWAAPGVPPSESFAISKEYAEDHGLPNPGQYPSWLNYPDERDLPVGIAARKAWAERKALRLRDSNDAIRIPVVPKRVVLGECMFCQKPVGPKDNCCRACFAKPQAELTGWKTEIADKKEQTSRTKAKIADTKPDIADRTCACGKPLGTDPRQRFCSDACRKKAARA